MFWIWKGCTSRHSMDFNKAITLPAPKHTALNIYSQLQNKVFPYKAGGPLYGSTGATAFGHFRHQGAVSIHTNLQGIRDLHEQKSAPSISLMNVNMTSACK